MYYIYFIIVLSNPIPNLLLRKRDNTNKNQQSSQEFKISINSIYNYILVSEDEEKRSAMAKILSGSSDDIEDTDLRRKSGNEKDITINATHKGEVKVRTYEQSNRTRSSSQPFNEKRDYTYSTDSFSCIFIYYLANGSAYGMDRSDRYSIDKRENEFRESETFDFSDDSIRTSSASNVTDDIRLIDNEQFELIKAQADIILKNIAEQQKKKNTKKYFNNIFLEVL